MSYGRDEDHNEKPITWLDVERALGDLQALKKIKQEMHELLEWLVKYLGNSDELSIKDIESAHGCISDLFGEHLYAINRRCDHVLTNYSDGYRKEVQSYWASTRL